MSIIQLVIEDELASVLGNDERPIQQAVRELIVLESYRRRAISSGRAAELLGMPRQEFIQHASQHGVPFFEMTAEEWDAECRQIKVLERP